MDHPILKVNKGSENIFFKNLTVNYEAFIKYVKSIFVMCFFSRNHLTTVWKWPKLESQSVLIINVPQKCLPIFLLEKEAFSTFKQIFTFQSIILINVRSQDDLVILLAIIFKWKFLNFFRLHIVVSKIKN